MKILYAIQGTGNGHLSRARDIIPELEKHARLDVMVSGIQADVSLQIPPKYRCKGMSFIFGKKGGIDFWRTYKKNYIRCFLREISALPVEQYDLVINDFEPVSAWACRRKKIPCIGLSHQSAVIAKGAPQPQHTDYFGRFILKNYAPVNEAYGFHFRNFSARIFTPIIRRQVRNLRICDQKHYTVYLPAYDDAVLVKNFSEFPHIKWKIFSKHCKKSYQNKNISVFPIDNHTFLESMAACQGVLCGAGFETPAEALFLQKKLLVIPMRGQYEQHCNAAALSVMGVPVVKSLKKKHLPKIGKWLEDTQHIKVHFPDIAAEVVETVLNNFEKQYT